VLCICEEERIYEVSGIILILTNIKLMFLCKAISFTGFEPVIETMITVYRVQ